jgi:hypothetical protein
VNANPSGSRTPSTGSRGRLEARRELAAATGPSQRLACFDVCAGVSGRAIRRVKGSNGGSRRAKKVCRGAPSLRCVAQGRVGDNFNPRRVAHQLVPHLLLSARTSAPADAVRPHPPGGARPWRPAESTAPVPVPPSRPEARPTDRSSPRPGARDTELVQPGCDVVATSACGHSRGKGVLAA